MLHHGYSRKGLFPVYRLALDAKCLLRDIDAMAVSKSLSKLSDFQPATASPYRVLHQAQGDKQEINNHHRKLMEVHNGTMHLFREKWVYFLFIALKRLAAF